MVHVAFQYVQCFFVLGFELGFARNEAINRQLSRELAVMASFYAVFHGPEGLKAIAQRIHRKTVRLAKGLEKAGFER